MTRLSVFIWIFLLGCLPGGGGGGVMPLPIYPPPPLPCLETAVVTITSPNVSEVILKGGELTEVLFTGTYKPTLSGSVVLRVNGGDPIVWVEEPNSSGGDLPPLSLFLPVGKVEVEVDQNVEDEEPPGILTFRVSPFKLESPKQGQLFQMREGGLGPIVFEGVYAPSTGPIEGRFAEGDWQILVAEPDPSGGAFRAVLEGQPFGRETVEVRISDLPETEFSVSDVGVGHVLVIAGQSNAVGKGAVLNDHFPPENFPGQKLFTYTVNRFWKEGGDSLHPLGMGSPHPELARKLGQNGVPVAFIQAAEDGTGLVSPPDWKRDSGLFYQRSLEMVEEATSGDNRVAAILWFQGETDANSLVVTKEAYRSALIDMTEGVHEVTGAVIVPALLWIPWEGSGVYHLGAGYTDVRQATIEAISLRPDLFREGPETIDLNREDSYHIGSEVSINILADRWCEALSFLGCL